MNTELKEIIKLVRKAGEKISEIYQRAPKVYEKEDGSVVTQADLASQRIILSGLRKYGYGFLSEESRDDLSRLKKEKIWIIDPLDGTRDFLDRTDQFSIMVALIYEREPILGVVYQPVGDKMYFAEKGNGAYVKEDGEPLRKLEASNVTYLSDACMVVSRSHLSDCERSFLAGNKVSRINYVGSIGVKLGLIAEGKADSYISFSNKTCQWDICAPEIVLKEAGGEVTDLKGEHFIYNRPQIRNLNGIIAGNKAIHGEIIRKLQHLVEGGAKKCLLTVEN